MNRELIVNLADPSKDGLARSPLSSVGATMSPVVTGDTETIVIYPVIPTGIQSRPWKSFDLTGYTIAASIGSPGEKPSGGTFKITYGTSTSDLSFDISPQDLETALNALALATSDGGVEVTGVAGDYYAITWLSNGARATAMTGEGKNLEPFGSVVVDVLQEGDASTKEVRFIRLRSQVFAISGAFSPAAALAAEVEVISPGDGTSHPIQSFGFTQQPIGGTFTITFDSITTNSLPFDATAEQLAEALGEGYVVEGISGGPWIVEKESNEAIAIGSMNVAGLAYLEGWEAEMAISTKEMFLALISSGANSITPTFEIELTDPSGKKNTVLQTDIEVKREVLSSGVLTSIINEFGIPAGAGALLYSIPQSLTGSQLAQIAENNGYPLYATLEEANAGEGEIGAHFFDTTLNKYRSTTALS